MFKDSLACIRKFVESDDKIRVMANVGDIMFGIWDIGFVGCWGSGMLAMRDVGDVGYSRYEMLGMWNVRDLGCAGCGMLRM